MSIYGNSLYLVTVACWEVRHFQEAGSIECTVGGGRALRRRSRWDNPAARVAEGSLGEVTQPEETLEHPQIGVKNASDSRHSENY
jgi:hypothetical protein